VLRKVTQDIDPETYPDLDKLIENMFETMYHADGIGFAAPQVGLEDRIFVMDLTPVADDEHPEFKDFKKVFINPHIIERSGEPVALEEGCLSIPGVHEKVTRPDTVRIRYIDENRQEREEVFSGYAARCIQHEYDHLDGILFTDHISPLRKRMVNGKLNALANGKARCSYKVKTAK